jgi:ABC-type multidrug transport system ATPase subunit
VSTTPARRHPKSPKAASREAATPKAPASPDATSPEAAPTQPARRKPQTPGALDLDGLTKSYGELVALAPLDLRVEHGEGVVLVGHNGSGKTTLLRLLAGVLEPSGGSFAVGGEAPSSLAARAALAYLSDSPTFYEDLSVWEHLEYVARLHGRATGDWEQDAADLLGHMGIYERADDLPTTFSRGLRQKAAIALAFVRPFDVLLVDEPFVGLDAAGKAALLDLFDDAHARGATLVVATHELQFVDRVARCVALRDGALVYDGTTDGIDVLSLVA